MSARSKHAKTQPTEEREPGPKSISGKEGEISGIRKPKHRLRGLKLAAKKTAAAVALVAGLAVTTAPAASSATSMASLRKPEEYSLQAREAEDPEGYAIKLPDEFAVFPKGQSASQRSKSLEKESRKFQIAQREDGVSVFEVKEGNSCLKIFARKSSATFRPIGSDGFMLDFSAYGMQNPVAMLERGKDGKMILHFIDALTNTDLTLSFPPGVSSAESVKAKAYREGKGPGAAKSVSASIAGIIGVGEEILDSERPKTIDEAHDIYSRMGAEMVNALREEYAAASPEQAPELANRGQAVIAAVLLRLYVSDDENAIRELDRLRTDPGIDKKKLESFAWKNGVLEEFQRIWPQCSASHEE